MVGGRHWGDTIRQPVRSDTPSRVQELHFNKPGSWRG
jgi:hypothetical protein